MKLVQLNIQAVRNVLEGVIDFHHRFNVFFGENGSGKTSILEAIHILGLGRTFRHHLIDPVINHHSVKLSLFARGIDEAGVKYQIGIEKDRIGKTLIRFNGCNLTSAATLAEHLPLQLIHPDSDELVTGSPKLRRQFMDWGTFHVEPQFYDLWKRIQKIIKQRNTALKRGLPREQVFIWDNDYVKLCEAISLSRANYLNKLQPIFDEMMQVLLTTRKVTLSYLPGWPQQENLQTLLEKNYYKDSILGYTYFGPQRDDILLTCENHPAAETLSRGEQKITIIALRLAQGKLLKTLSHKQSLYLLDDYAAELDKIHRQKVLEVLNDLQAQVFLTTISYQEVQKEFNFLELATFYVEHGRVKPL